VFTINVNDKELAKKVETYRSTLASGDLGFQTASRELYDLLLKPAAAQLADKTNLIIVPDGPLWDLPFQALQNRQNKYLAEQAAVSYAPSLTALMQMRKKAGSRKRDAEMELLAFGNPIVATETSQKVKQVFMGEGMEPLPESERLVDELGQMYGTSSSKVFVGAQAREETAKSEAPKYRIVQFATHGILNNLSPMYSHLVLAQNEKDPNEDGLLEAWEMKDLDLKADMVILSACDTARGRISNGEGVIGMSWALFIAGTPTTVASQWKVESKSTTELMLEFHRQLLTGKVSKAEALRRAELKVMKMPGFGHPSYWAPFVIVGDGS
jgi:CHAT domain-containing protein